MKKYLILRLALSILIGFYLLIISTDVIGQDKQYKARLSVDYQHTMGEKSVLLINGKFKGENGYEPITKLILNVYHEIKEDSTILVGQTTTDHWGNAEFEIPGYEIYKDSIIKHTFLVKIEDSKRFKNLKKAVSYQDATLVAEPVIEDSINYIAAKLNNAMGEPIEGVKLTVLVHRLFAPLTIGKSSYKTDNDGTILVPIVKPLPGIDGVLTFEVMLDSRKYGIVRKVFDAAIGEPVIEISTFDNRTMWSPPGKTPLFLLIFPNLVILGIWMIIILLITNLYKIYKS